jgi:hypothetical protein
MSLLWVHKDDVLPWFCDHYIQLVVKSKDYASDWANFYDGIFIANIEPIHSCSFCMYQRVDKTVRNKSFTEFTEFIETQINHGYYIETWLDQYFISCSNCYNKSHFMHSNFIYGYDNDKKVVYVSDFFKHGMYKSEVVSYEEINQSYTLEYQIGNIPSWFLWIRLYKYVGYQYKLNKDLLLLGLNNYINCKDSFNRFDNASVTYDPVYFGLDYYNLLIEHCYSVKYNLDIRAFHVLYDHKIAMLIRLEYLNEERLINNYHKLKQKCENLLNETLKMQNMALKYKVNKNDTILIKIISTCRSLYNMDYDITNELISNIL